MSKKEEKALTTQDTLAVARQQTDELVDQILKEGDVDKLKEMAHLFTAYDIKRNIAREGTYQDTQDMLISVFNERLHSNPNNFSNADLASWMKALQQAQDANQAGIAKLDETPTVISQQSTQVNVSIIDSLNRESIDRVNDVLSKIMKGTAQSKVIEEPEMEEAEIIEEETDKQ